MNTDFIVVEAVAAPAMLFGALTGRNRFGACAGAAMLAGLAIGFIGVWIESKTYRQP